MVGRYVGTLVLTAGMRFGGGGEGVGVLGQREEKWRECGGLRAGEVFSAVSSEISKIGVENGVSYEDDAQTRAGGAARDRAADITTQASAPVQLGAWPSRTLLAPSQVH